LILPEISKKVRIVTAKLENYAVALGAAKVALERDEAVAGNDEFRVPTRIRQRRQSGQRG
jgi:hypothetical protein